MADLRAPLRGVVPLLVLALLAISTLAPSGSAAPTGAWAEEVVLVEDASAGAFSPALALDGHDGSHVVYVRANITSMVKSDEQGASVTTFASGNLFLTVVGQDGNTQVPPLPLTFLDDTDGYQIEAPSVAVDGLGNTHVVWSDTAGESGTYDVHYLRTDAAGTIGVELPIAVTPKHSRFAAIAASPSGTAHIVWADERDGLQKQVYYSQVSPAGELVVDAQPISPFVTLFEASHPAIALNPRTDDVAIVWEQRALAVVSDDLYYELLDPAGAVLTPPTQLTNSLQSEERPALCFDDASRLHLSWQDGRNGNLEVYHRFVSAEPKVDNGQRMTISSQDSLSPQLATYSDSETLLVWTQKVGQINDKTHVTRLRLGQLGAPLSSEPAYVVDRSGLSAAFPAVAIDRSDHPVVVWSDARNVGPEQTPTWTLLYSRGVDGLDRAPVPVLTVHLGDVPLEGGPLSVPLGATVEFNATNSSDPDGWDSIADHSFDLGDANVTGWGAPPVLQHAYERPGSYEVVLLVRDRFGLQTEVRRTLSVVAPHGPVHTAPRDDTQLLVAAGTVGGAGGLLLAFVAGTEVGRYKALSLLVVPLYSRIRREKTLDNYIRGQIHGYILGNPGCHYNQVKQVLNLNNGTLAYHLRKLEKEEFIKSRRDGMYKRFYAFGMTLTTHVITLSPIQRQILDLITVAPGISQKEVAEELGISAPAVVYHMGVLHANRLVRREKNGVKVRYFPAQPEGEYEIATGPASAPEG